MDQPLHSIRLKRGDVEFELTGSRDDVARAWDALRPSVTTAFETTAPARRPAPSGTEGGGAERRNRSRRSTGGSGAGSRGGGRPDVVEALAEAPVEEFPEIGDDPSALYAGFATLSWARDSLQIDGLQISELHTFLTQRFRIPHVPNAYRQAFGRMPRAVHGTGSPRMFRLMSPGDRALDSYLRTLATGATPAEAEAEAAPEAAGD